MTSTVHGAPEASKSAPGASGLQEAASAAVVAAVLVAAVYFGRPLLVPLALSILLAFALAPVAEFLRRLKLGRIGAVILTVTLAVLLISGIAAFIGTQLAWLAQSLPQYQQNIVAKIQSVEGSATNNGMIQGALNMFNNLSDQIANVPRPGKNDQLESKTTSQRTDPAIPVVIRTPAPRPIEVIQNVGGPLLEPLANLAIIIIFVIFILLQKEDLRDRFIMLAGARDLQRTTTALDDGAERLSRYLLLQTAVNAVFGTLVGLGLWAVGVPNPALWGLIAAMFRFVP
ncbi:MAG: AI-2E family transporter, partial [Rhizomicrobium sp.]